MSTTCGANSLTIPQQVTQKVSAVAMIQGLEFHHSFERALRDCVVFYLTRQNTRSGRTAFKFRPRAITIERLADFGNSLRGPIREAFNKEVEAIQAMKDDPKACRALAVLVFEGEGGIGFSPQTFDRATWTRMPNWKDVIMGFWSTP